MIYNSIPMGVGKDMIGKASGLFTATVLSAIAMTISAQTAEIVRDGAAVFLSGPIVAKDLQAFHNAVGDDEKLTVYLSSPGGEVHPATMIGVLIRVRSYATMVPAGAICASACALIWMAGVPRELGVRAHLGLHCTRLGLNETKCYGPGSAQQQAYLQSMWAPWDVATIPRGGMQMIWVAPNTHGLVITENDIPELRWILGFACAIGGMRAVEWRCEK
jgi:hypothetical protein